MKKILTLFVFSILLVSPFVIAQELDRKAGITPESIFYGLDIALEKIRMAFTFGKENKINYGLRRAEERLAELEYIEDPTKFGKNFAFSSERVIELMNEVDQERVKILQDVKERVSTDKSREVIQGVIDGIDKGIDKGIDLRDKITKSDYNG